MTKYMASGKFDRIWIGLQNQRRNDTLHNGIQNNDTISFKIHSVYLQQLILSVAMFSFMFCSKILMLSVIMLDVMEPNQAVLEGHVNITFC
jgi:hypothetical protein